MCLEGILDAASDAVVDDLDFEVRVERGEEPEPIFCLRTCSSSAATARARIFATSPSGIEWRKRVRSSWSCSWTPWSATKRMQYRSAPSGSQRALSLSGEGVGVEGFNPRDAEGVAEAAVACTASDLAARSLAAELLESLGSPAKRAVGARRTEVVISAFGIRSAIRCLTSRAVAWRAMATHSAALPPSRCGAIKLAAVRWMSPLCKAARSSGNLRAARATAIRLYATLSAKWSTWTQ